MNEEEIETARALVACGRWQWLPGMLLRDLTRSKRGRVHKVGNDWVVYFGINSESRYRCETVGYSVVPDITDPATVGCLLARARSAWNRPTAFLYWYGGSWFFEPQQSEPTDHPRGRTEAEALLRALQAAPEAS
jgi:hypothetical protein